MAQRLSPHITVMANAAQKAAKRLLRDFAEVEQLQVSIKGPSDFVSQADIRAELSDTPIALRLRSVTGSVARLLLAPAVVFVPDVGAVLIAR